MDLFHINVTTSGLLFLLTFQRVKERNVVDNLGTKAMDKRSVVEQLMKMNIEDSQASSLSNFKPQFQHQRATIKMTEEFDFIVPQLFKILQLLLGEIK
jgi:ethanolamine utilization protein EutQ (cupin superfamily)